MAAFAAPGDSTVSFQKDWASLGIIAVITVARLELA